MKVWCQSCGAFGKNPIWNEYEQSLNIRAQEIIRSDTTVEFHGCSVIPGVDGYYAALNICKMQSIRNAIRAEREGYDVFVMISNADAGYHEIREMVDIPVVFMLENAIHFALLFSPNFAFFTHNKAILSKKLDYTKQYGLAERMVQGGHLDIKYTDWPDMFGNPKKYIDNIIQRAREIISNGAGILISAALPLSIWLIKQGVNKIDGVRILDSFGCALKMAELLVDMNKLDIGRIKYVPASSEDVLAEIRKLYLEYR